MQDIVLERFNPLPIAGKSPIFQLWGADFVKKPVTVIYSQGLRPGLSDCHPSGVYQRPLTSGELYNQSGFCQQPDLFGEQLVTSN